MTAQPPARSLSTPVGGVQVDLWGNDSPKPSDGHTAPRRKKAVEGDISPLGTHEFKDGKWRRISRRKLATEARRQRKVTRRLYVPVDDLLLEDLALVAKASGTSIPELARVVLYRGMGLAS